MKFIEIKPQRVRANKNAPNVIRVSFSHVKKLNKYNLNIYIGVNEARKIGFKDGDKIKFFVDEENSRLWLIKKAEDEAGYKLVDPKKDKDATVFRLQLPWNLDTPNNNELSVKEVRHEMYEGGFLIWANE